MVKAWCHQVYQFSSEIWPGRSGLISVRKRDICWRKRFWENWKLKGKDGRGRFRAYPVSLKTLTIWNSLHLHIFCFYILTLILYSQLLRCWKTQNIFVWRSSSLDKERNITPKPVISVWFIHFSTLFHYLVRIMKIYHFSIYIYIYIS